MGEDGGAFEQQRQALAIAEMRLGKRLRGAAFEGAVAELLGDGRPPLRSSRTRDRGVARRR
jgi:hypothetical protein